MRLNTLTLASHNMEAQAFFWLAIHQQQREKHAQRAKDHQSSYQHKPFRESKLYTKVSSKVSSTVHKVTDRITKKNATPKVVMPSIHILYVSADPDKGPQFVRLARKGFTRTVVFTHPKGETYKLPSSTLLKGYNALYEFPNYALFQGYERDCGPATAPVFGGTRACEGGCCGWFSTDAEEDEILDYVMAGEKGERPKHDIFLVRHGDVETTEARFLEEGLEAIRTDGRGWLGKPKAYQ